MVGPWTEDPPRLRVRTRRLMVAVGFPLGAVLVALGAVSWKIAGQPANRSQGLVAQMQMLLGAFQGTLGLCVALAMIYYAGRTGEMVESMRGASRREQKATLRVAVDRLHEATIDAVAECGPFANLMKPDWRWNLPWRGVTRATFLQQAYPRLTTHVASVVKAAETLKGLEPSLEQAVTKVAMAVESTFEAAVAGRANEVIAGAGKVRAASVALRMAADAVVGG